MEIICATFHSKQNNYFLVTISFLLTWQLTSIVNSFVVDHVHAQAVSGKRWANLCVFVCRTSLSLSLFLVHFDSPNRVHNTQYTLYAHIIRYILYKCNFYWRFRPFCSIFSMCLMRCRSGTPLGCVFNAKKLSSRWVLFIVRDTYLPICDTLQSNVVWRFLESAECSYMYWVRV